jgi:hypothetical protein
MPVPMRFRELVFLRTERATVSGQNRPGSWRVALLAHFDDQYGRQQFEVIEVRIAAYDDPGAELHAFQHAELIGFRIQEYPGPQPGRMVRWFAAEQVRGRQR